MGDSPSINQSKMFNVHHARTKKISTKPVSSTALAHREDTQSDGVGSWWEGFVRTYRAISGQFLLHRIWLNEWQNS